MLTGNSSVSEISGIGPKLLKTLHTIQIRCVSDLLFYFPSRYVDFSQFSKIADAKPGEVITIRATLKSIAARFSYKSHTSLCEAVVSDDTGSLKVLWFNQAYLARSLASGDDVFLSGKVEQYKGIQLTNPVHEKLNDIMIHTGRIVPMYRAIDGLYTRTLRTLVKEALVAADSLQDSLPAYIAQKYHLPSLAEAIRELHFPQNQESLNSAKLRMVFEEVLVEQLAMLRHKQLLAQSPAPKIKPNIKLTKAFLKTLPFELTLSQKKAAWEIMQDMEIKHPMNRLLQGDVGSGKTLVAVLAVLQVLDASFQAAIIAPTEILAKQHYESITSYIEKFSKKFSIALLTSNFHTTNKGAVTKAELLGSLSSGTIDLAIGTHAVIQKGVQFSKLGLVVIDEQHRFGVQQRSFLQKEAPVIQKNADHIPHLLSMSATPIPRTLALSMYGDLELSTLMEFPKGRQQIETRIIAEKDRAKAYTFIQKEVSAGRQAFVITPRVEDSETSDVKSVKKEFERLSKDIFPNMKLGLLYGKMKGKEKDAVMEKFNAGDLDILVATSVIEIGIDVPNATVMLIEGAQTFGLAQLHQLRGRVGRGKFKSYCLLFTDTDQLETTERLSLFAKSHDGFALAQYDLEKRGFGSLLGQDQTGFNFRFSAYLTLKVLSSAKEAATLLLEKDPTLKKSIILRKKSDLILDTIHLE